MMKITKSQTEAIKDRIVQLEKNPDQLMYLKNDIIKDTKLMLNVIEKIRDEVTYTEDPDVILTILDILDARWSGS